MILTALARLGKDATLRQTASGEPQGATLRHFYAQRKPHENV